MVKKWFITGGCGFIGTSLVARILNANPQAVIVIMDNLSVGTRDDLAEVCEFIETESVEPEKPGVQLIVADITDFNAVARLVAGSECIVHLAANTGVGPSVDDPRADMQANVIGTFNLLEAVRLNNVKQFVFASSGAPAGIVEPPIHEEVAPHPVSPYGASKLAGEGYCSAYFQTFAINTIALRFGNVYGPRSTHKSSVVAKFIKAALDGQPCEIYGDGKQTRDFIFIDDLIGAILKAAEFDGGGEVFQIASNKERTVNEIAVMLQQIIKAQCAVDMEFNHTEERLGDVKRNYSDTTKAKQLLGWTSQTNLQEGLEKTVAFYKSLMGTKPC